MPTMAFHTLGCKVNFYDTEAIWQLFKNEGYEQVDFEQTADVYLINTCTVTNTGAKKSRQIIRRAIRRNPDAVIARYRLLRSDLARRRFWRFRASIS